MREIVAQFDGYTLRTVDAADAPALETWISADPAHKATLTPDFFMGRLNTGGETAEDLRATCYALEDGQGVLFFIRLSRASRVYMQFNPESNRRRAALGLIKGMAFLEVGLARAGAEEWIFRTEEPRLAEMARRRLGFEPRPNEMVRTIERLEPERPAEGTH